MGTLTPIIGFLLLSPALVLQSSHWAVVDADLEVGGSFACQAGMRGKAGADTAELPPEVRNRLTPILDASCAAMETQYDDASLARVGNRLSTLLQEQSSAADEAVVLLLGYHLGDAYEYDVLRNVTQRGRPVLRYLLRYKDQVAEFDSRPCLQKLKVNWDRRETDFQTAITAVRNQEVWGTSFRRQLSAGKDPAELVIPLLNLACEMFNNRSSWRAVPKVEMVIGDLLGDRGVVADEALVILFHYYVGDHNGEELWEGVVTRGKRMIPYLMKYRDHPPKLTGLRCREVFRLGADTVREQFDSAIRAIEGPERTAGTT